MPDFFTNMALNITFFFFCPFNISLGTVNWKGGRYRFNQIRQFVKQTRELAVDRVDLNADNKK